MNICVTGASGFIGRHLCRSLSHAGYHILSLGRTQVTGIDAFEPWNLADPLKSGALNNIDVVFHLAGMAHALNEPLKSEQTYFRINTEATKKLLEECKRAQVRRFVLLSSIKSMGEGHHLCLDERAKCAPQTPYGRSKLQAEHWVLEGGYVPEPVVLRSSMVFGATHKGNLSRMILAIAKGYFPPLPEFNNQRSMVHVEDIVDAAILSSKHSKAIGRTYIVTDGQPYATCAIYNWICEILGKPYRQWRVPIRVLKSLGTLGDAIGRLRGRRFMFDSDAFNRLAGSEWYSNAKIQHEIGFVPKRFLRQSLPDIVRFLGLHCATSFDLHRRASQHHPIRNNESDAC